MQPGSQEIQQTADILRFAEPGKQTQITPSIIHIANNITGNVFDKTRRIVQEVSALKNTHFDLNLFRKRTADQILKDGFVTGCTDSDLVFVTLARASGLPTKYVETIDQSWLEKGSESISGHQYAQVYDKETRRWFWVDPMGKRIDILPPENDGRIIYQEGLDSWDIGITDFNSLREAFSDFREGWLKQK